MLKLYIQKHIQILGAESSEFFYNKPTHVVSIQRPPPVTFSSHYPLKGNQHPDL